MADFDNGLPPIGTTTEAKVSSVSIHTEEVNADTGLQAKAVVLDKLIAVEVEEIRIKAITIDKEGDSSGNWFSFL